MSWEKSRKIISVNTFDLQSSTSALLRAAFAVALSNNFSLPDVPRNIERVNSVCLKLGFGRRDQRCHNRITVLNHTEASRECQAAVSDVFLTEKCCFVSLPRLIFLNLLLHV